MLEWLTTIPGILILCGVILLIIAIILFIVGAKKSKKEEAINSNPAVDNNLNNVNNEVQNIDVTPTVSEPVVTEPVENTVVTIEEPVNVAPVEPIVEPVPSFIDNNEPVVAQPEEPQKMVINMPTMDEVEEVKPTTDTMVYGGEMPKIEIPVEEKPVTIYGGNDPLEATQTLPKMEENHVPYGGSYPEVKIVEPTIEPVIPTPVEETVTEMPTVMPVVEPINDTVSYTEPVVTPVINEPEIVNIPVEEPVIIDEPQVVNIIPEVSNQTTEVEEL